MPRCRTAKSATASRKRISGVTILMRGALSCSGRRMDLTPVAPVGRQIIERYATNAGKKIRGINKKSLALLQSYPWPGNIRELQNVIERSVIVCDTENFSVDESWLSRRPPATDASREIGLSKKLPSEEKAIIEAALTECHGQVSGPSGAAAKLGIPGSTLESKIKALKIDKNRFKSAYLSTTGN